MEKYLSCEEIAEKFGVKLTTVWGWIRNKKLPAVKSGKLYHIKPSDLANFEQKHITV